MNKLDMDPLFESQLKSSGVSFAVTYYGSVPIEASVSAMVTELRSQVITECIRCVASCLKIIPEPHQFNSIVERFVGPVKEENYPVEMNISAKMIKMIRNSRMIQRHPLKFFSLACQGTNGTEIEYMAGYISKNKDGTDRRCHVIGLPDVAKLMDVLSSAIAVAQVLNQEENEAKGTIADSPSGSSNSLAQNDGFATPTLPARFKRPVNIDEDVKTQIWYHGCLSREQAHELLVQPGDFLVRKSDHSPGQYILSGMTNEMGHKHLFLLDEKNRVRTKESRFDTITELIEHHHMNGKAVQTRFDTSLNLIRPIPNSTATGDVTMNIYS